MSIDIYCHPSSNFNQISTITSKKCSILFIIISPLKSKYISRTMMDYRDLFHSIYGSISLIRWNHSYEELHLYETKYPFTSSSIRGESPHSLEMSMYSKSICSSIRMVFPFVILDLFVHKNRIFSEQKKISSMNSFPFGSIPFSS